MSEFAALRADLHALHQAIEAPVPLVEIRVMTLRVLTRHRCFTEEILRATHDWEFYRECQDYQERQNQVWEQNRDQISSLLEQGVDGFRSVRRLLEEQAPPPACGYERGHFAIGKLLKSVVHRIAQVCIRDRQEEADKFWSTFPDRENLNDRCEHLLARLPPETLANIEDIARKEQERSEPGDDEVDQEALIGSDECFEEHRQRLLSKVSQDLQVCLMVFERRLQFGQNYDGLDLINDNQILHGQYCETPDWQADPQRDELVAKLTAMTS